MDGTGGTYFFKDPSHRNVGCFKPQDEEPFGPHNPRGLVGELGQVRIFQQECAGYSIETDYGFSTTVLLSRVDYEEGFYREKHVSGNLRRIFSTRFVHLRYIRLLMVPHIVKLMLRFAIYFLQDHFAGVPATSLVEARHPVFKYGDGGPHYFKIGSLQEFVRHDDVVSDLAPNQFTLHQVHKIVLLDMRLLNTDRNDANILVRKKRSATSGQVEYELIPIDHGYCLPQFLEIAWCDWCWYNWPQLKQPLSAEDREYVLSLSARDETESLTKKIPLRRACRRNMIIAAMVVQKGVKANLVLYDIARIMCRDDLDAPSTLEKMCLDAFHQLQVQRKASEQQLHMFTSSSTALSSYTPPPSSPRSAKANLRISIDASTRGSFSGGQSPIDTGVRSPPGFWASFAPFSADDDDDDDDEEYEDDDEPDCPLQQPKNGQHPSTSWDQMASQALSNAAKQTNSVNSSKGALNSTAAGAHGAFKPQTPPSSFSAEPERDEFETLNDALDENAQDEKLFLAILGRLMDEQVDKCRRSQQQQQPTQRTTHSRR